MNYKQNEKILQVTEKTLYNNLPQKFTKYEERLK